MGAAMYMVLDCETCGLPNSRTAPVADLDNWPRAVQIAWATYDSEHRETASRCRIIKPEGFRIPADASRVHGITTQRAIAEGFPARDVLYELQQATAGVRHFVAHNAKFDGSVIAAEFLRQGWQPPFAPDSMICTMEAGTDICRLPGPYGYKWPKLDELYGALFGTAFGGAHDARVDAAACACCFFELKNRGMIRLG